MGLVLNSHKFDDPQQSMLNGSKEEQQQDTAGRIEYQNAGADVSAIDVKD